MRSEIRFALATALAGGIAFLATEVVSVAKEPALQEPGAADMVEMMAKMQKLAAPGKEHAELAKLAGKWQQNYKMRHSPDGPWMEGSGTSVAESLLGGRYIQEKIQFDVKFAMGGMPEQTMKVEGMHILGYDNMSEEYISLWMDSHSTWWNTSRGKAGADGVCEMKGTMIDVAGSRPFRMVIRHEGDDHVVSEMYDTIQPHGEVLVMTIDAKRVK